MLPPEVLPLCSRFSIPPTQRTPAPVRELVMFVVPWKRTVIVVNGRSAVLLKVSVSAASDVEPDPERIAPPEPPETKLLQPFVAPAGTCGLPHGQVTMAPTPGAQNFDSMP